MSKALSQRKHEKRLRRVSRQARGRVRRGGVTRPRPREDDDVIAARVLASLSTFARHIIGLRHDPADCRECQRKRARRT